MLFVTFNINKVWIVSYFCFFEVVLIYSFESELVHVIYHRVNRITSRF